VRSTRRSNVHSGSLARWFARSGLIGGVLAAAVAVAELGITSPEQASCPLLTTRYDASDGGQLVVAACWAGWTIAGPVGVRFEIDLRLLVQPWPAPVKTPRHAVPWPAPTAANGERA
jgi:hypothetical protein